MNEECKGDDFGFSEPKRVRADDNVKRKELPSVTRFRCRSCRKVIEMDTFMVFIGHPMCCDQVMDKLS